MTWCSERKPGMSIIFISCRLICGRAWTRKRFFGPFLRRALRIFMGLRIRLFTAMDISWGVLSPLRIMYSFTLLPARRSSWKDWTYNWQKCRNEELSFAHRLMKYDSSLIIIFVCSTWYHIKKAELLHLFSIFKILDVISAERHLRRSHPSVAIVEVIERILTLWC